MHFRPLQAAVEAGIWSNDEDVRAVPITRLAARSPCRRSEVQTRQDPVAFDRRGTAVHMRSVLLLRASRPARLVVPVRVEGANGRQAGPGSEGRAPGGAATRWCVHDRPAP